MMIFKRKKEETKTKWEPLYFYNPIASNSIKLVQMRYDKKTGIFEFQSKTVCKNLYHPERFYIDLDPNTQFQKILRRNDYKGFQL